MNNLLHQGLALQAASVSQTLKVLCRSCDGTGIATQQRIDGREETGGVCRRCDGLGFREIDYRMIGPARASALDGKIMDAEERAEYGYPGRSTW